jgi:hypothetical protein
LFLKAGIMKKYFIFLVVAILSFCQVEAQHKLVKLWETDSVLKVPESVLYDQQNKVLYVSNIDGEPWGKDGKGFISKLSLDGKVIAKEWVTGLNAPKGMGLYKNKLYVADLSEIVVIDIAKAVIVSRLKVTGATGLNDITIAANSILSVSDSKNKMVYTFPVDFFKKLSLVLDSTDLKGPNGLLAYNNLLYVLDAGSLYTYKADKKTGKQFVEIANGMETSTDGIENVVGNEFIVSSWSGVVYYINADGSKQVLLDGRAQKINSADIGFNHAERIVYIPTFWKNTVAAYKLQ